MDNETKEKAVSLAAEAGKKAAGFWAVCKNRIVALWKSGRKGKAVCIGGVMVLLMLGRCGGKGDGNNSDSGGGDVDVVSAAVSSTDVSDNTSSGESVSGGGLAKVVLKALSDNGSGKTKKGNGEDKASEDKNAHAAADAKPKAELVAEGTSVSSSKGTQLVTATGYGMTVEEAKRAAVRSAVEAVVGTLVDAETLVENDELVQNKILSYSTGMVDDVKIIGEPQKSPEGLVTVRAQVKVRKMELAARVKSTIKTSVKIDGESLYQKVTFNQKNLNDAGSIIKSLFRPERMQGLLKFEPDMDKGNPISVDARTGEVTVSIKGGIDWAAYTQWTDEIIEKLTPMATKKMVKFANFNWDGDSFYESCGEINIFHNYDSTGLRILRDFRSFEVVGLQFDKDKQALLGKQLAHYSSLGSEYYWTLSVTLLDKGGKPIKNQSFHLADNFNRHVIIIGNNDNYHEIYPAFAQWEWKRHKNTNPMGPFERSSISLGSVKLADIRELGEISVEISLEKER